MNKLAVVITHPIQYYVPVFKLLAQQCRLKVFYTWGKDGVKAKHDPGFGKTVEWDLPLLEGYDYELLENLAKDPGSHHGKGIINPEIIRKIEDFNPHAILIYGYIYHSHFRVMRHFRGKTKVWFRGDSTLLDKESVLKSFLKKIYLKWVYSFVDIAFYVGTNNKAYFKKYGLKEEQLIFAPHAIDNERFLESKQNEALRLRKSLGINNEDILILFAGKLEPKKNPALLLDAFLSYSFSINNHNYINENKAIHLLFVGNGILESALKQKKNDSQQARNTIHFMDFQNQTQMPIVYQACDLFCLPSKGPGETWGLAVNEAMAAGKPVLISDKVGCGLDLVNSDTGMIFTSNDINDLKQKLITLSDKELLNKMGTNAEKFIQNWSIKRQAGIIIDYVNR